MVGPWQRVEKVLGALRYAPQLEGAVGWVQRRLRGAPFVALQWRTEKALNRRTHPWRVTQCARGPLPVQRAPSAS